MQLLVALAGFVQSCFIKYGHRRILSRQQDTVNEGKAAISGTLVKYIYIYIIFYFSITLLHKVFLYRKSCISN